MRVSRHMSEGGDRGTAARGRAPGSRKHDPGSREHDPREQGAQDSRAVSTQKLKGMGAGSEEAGAGSEGGREKVPPSCPTGKVSTTLFRDYGQVNG
jgi:hypothetical protein